MTKKLSKEELAIVREEWYSPSQIAEEYGLSYKTILMYVSTRKIPHIKIGKRAYFDPKVVDKYFGDAINVKYINY